ncbi:MAG: uncharacterized membrane protein (UPF0182 family) [Candidatus Latescibacterota bacterium]|jgi:uncharacterized membrane protein (UPF0182 family)
MGFKRKTLLTLGVVFFAIMGSSMLASFYTNWLWFQSIEFQSVFWRMLRARFTTGISFGVLAVLLIGTNLWLARRSVLRTLREVGLPWEGAEAIAGVLRSRSLYLITGGLLVWLFTSIGAGQWPLWLRYTHSQPFGISDPIFGRDLGFYVFSLPLYGFVAKFLLSGILTTGFFTVLIYGLGSGIRFQQRFQVLPSTQAHLSGLGGLMLLVIAWIYRLKIYGLLYSDGWVAFGAGYVDVNVQVWTYWLLVFLYLGAAALFFINIRTRGTRLPLIGGGLLIGGAIIVGAIPSALVQKLVVEPSELELEAPYIRHNIQATRRAYGLDRIEEQPFEATENLTQADIEANPLTIRNVRVWDERPLKQTYQQVQEIRPYYVFPDVDVDRYTVDGVYRQVMLSAREIDTNRLPAQARNWVNERLQYTHGYGVALSPVNQVTPEGLPDFMVKDLPPVSAPGLEIERPEIYYGERSYGYAIVKTSMQEFDYPSGDENKFTTYQGTGGVRMGSFFERLAFAARFADLNLILSNYITPESRIMLRRQIRERVQAITPFLRYDSDPYMVLSEGKLYWIIDAYTTTDMYPYSTRGGAPSFNYMRNSVKAVVDAYSGAISFYRMDTQDPIVAAYDEIFPNLFKAREEMSEDLKAHLRYPKDMFKYQALIYRSYHMQDVQVFYNQEDLWEVPKEIYKDRPQRMEPYYIIVKLPGEEREEFLLMVPFTPARKDNMIGWLAARCDGENYGSLLAYTLPKDRMIFGPMQLEARIDQQTEISSQLTLWGQGGSEVIRGNLLAIPIGRSFLYVEPIYLQARQEPQSSPFPVAVGMPEEQMPSRERTRSTAIPELKQVIVAFAGQVVMRDTFEEALSDLFGARTAPEGRLVETGAASAIPSSSAVRSAAKMAAEAEAHYQRVRTSLQKWDWTEAGEGMEALELTLTKLREVLEDE